MPDSPAAPASRGRALLNDAAVLAVGSLASRLLGFALLPLYTHALTPTEFGQVELLVTASDLLVPLLFLCLQDGVLRFAIKSRDLADDVFVAMCLFWGLVSVGVLASSLVGARLHGDMALLLGGLVLSQAAAVTIGAWVRATGKIKLFALAGLLQVAVVGASNVLFLVVRDDGYQGYAWSLILGYLVGIVVLLVCSDWLGALRRGRFSSSLLRQIVWFSAPLVPNVLLWWAVNLSGRWFVAAYDSLAGVGLFAVASRVVSIVAVVTTVFLQAWQLAAHRARDRGDADAAEFYGAIERAYFACLAIVVSALLSVSEPLIAAISPSEYHEAWILLPPLLLGALFSGMAAFLGAILTSFHATSAVLRSTILAGCLALILNAAIVPVAGATGAACVVSASFLVLWLVRRQQVLSRAQYAMGLGRVWLVLGVLGIQAVLLFVDVAAILRIFMTLACLMTIGLLQWSSLIAVPRSFLPLKRGRHPDS